MPSTSICDAKVVTLDVTDSGEAPGRTDRKIINVSNRLPVTVGKRIRKSSGGLVTALETYAGEDNQLTWIGWPGAAVPDSAKRDALTSQLRDEYGYRPVFLSKNDVNAYYQGFSNASVWPLFHYMPNYMHYDNAWWDGYKRVNKLFAERVLSCADEGDMVWVHDYHLMLVPELIKSKRPDLNIGFFLHTPFPSYEVFRCHPNRLELLEGLLGADLIGFHTFGYLRHFRSSVLRLLGLESDMNTILHSGRETHIGVYPIGISAGKFLDELSSQRFRRKREALRKAYSGKQVVLSVERLDYTKGIIHRLKAIDDFLSSYPDKNRICFIFVSVPSRGEVREYQLLRAEIEGLIGQINGRHATIENTPINFLFRSVSFTELCALYSMADVGLVTPLIDGMNLVAKEYVVCQSDQPGVLMLSEFAGAAEELFDAITVNPYDSQDVAGKLEQALTMSKTERQRRMKQMRERVIEFDSTYWARSFLSDLASRQPSGQEPVEGDSATIEIIERAHASERQAFCLDYDGTLREFEDDPDKAEPTEEIRHLLRELDSTPDLDVLLVSGRKRTDLDQWFANHRVTLVAEHGACFRRPGNDSWQTVNPNVDLSWKDQVLEVLRHYEGSTPGSWVEDKPSAVVWHYRRADPEFGKWKASLLMGELVEMLSNLPVEIHHGKCIVEVSSLHISKKVAIEHLLQDSDYAFVLCAGDDQTDESMFLLEHEKLVSVKVGQGVTHARYRVADPAAFRELLRQMISIHVA